MSYDISLLDPVTKEVVELDNPHQMSGGTYAVGGTSEAWLNVTYNYAKHYSGIGENGIRTINGMTGVESIPLLEKVAADLGNDVDENDYWNPTEGNAKLALMQLVALAKMRPDGIWEVR